MLDEQGEVVSRDIPRILGALKCGHELMGSALPAGYNSTVTRVKQLFAEEVTHRQAEREHRLGLSSGQRYILREMRLLFGVTTEDDIKVQINVLEKAFRGRVTKAINKELNLLRRNGVTGDGLLKTLANLFTQHNMRSWMDRQGSLLTHPTPKIVCSEALGVS
ncbi:MAG: hypothetical protein P0120_18465 [Nitrospira sp.]|nr:hypothetical protein [Nitrospira sp.]